MSAVYTQHKLSAAFPSMTPAEFEALVIDIRDHGQRDPIITYQGQILDGMHRYRACLECGKEPWIKPEPYSGIDPAGWVLSRNLHRRHMSASQRAGAIVACNEWRHRGGDQKAIGNVADCSQTSAQLAETAQVSERLIVDAKTAHKAGFSEAMRKGEATASEAANLVRKAPEVAALVVAEKITLEQGKAELKDREAKPEKRSFAPPESLQIVQLTAEKDALEVALAAKNAEILELELAGVDEGARNEARDKLQGYVDAMHDAIRQEQAALALLDEANYKNGELLRANNAQDAQIKALKRRITELEK